MPRHKQVTACRKGGGPVSKFCSCEHCCLSVCSVCGASEGSLTTDCPGVPVGFDKHTEVYETKLDYTDERGWHQGDPTERRSPRFGKRNPALEHDCPACRSKRGEDCWIEMSLTGHVMGEIAAVDNVWTHLARVKLADEPGRARHIPLLAAMTFVDPGDARIHGCTCGWRTPKSFTDSDDSFAAHVAMVKLSPTTDWSATDRQTDLQRTLAQKARAWVLADRSCEERSADLTRIENEVDARLPKGQEQSGLTKHARKLIGQLEQAKINFRLADQHAQKCDDEFRQVARKLVDTLEMGTVLVTGTEEALAHTKET